MPRVSTTRPARGVVIVTVVNYVVTDIGKYVEYSLAVACTHGRKPAPPLLPALFMKHYGTGQFVVDLPVSSEVSAVVMAVPADGPSLGMAPAGTCR